MPAAPPTNSTHAETREAWREWLTHHHTRKEGVWLITNKKSSGLSHLPYNDAVEEALCFGWVDSKPGKLDETRTMLWFAPRKPKSAWSALNKARVERLERQGQMQPPGNWAVERAKKNGAWIALDDVEALKIPDDLSKALAAYPSATKHFAEFPRSTKRGILEWISNAKMPQTRKQRIEDTAEKAAQNIRANQWRK